jgi:hypothetical protein
MEGIADGIHPLVMIPERDLRTRRQVEFEGDENGLLEFIDGALTTRHLENQIGQLSSVNPPAPDHQAMPTRLGVGSGDQLLAAVGQEIGPGPYRDRPAICLQTFDQGSGQKRRALGRYLILAVAPSPSSHRLPLSLTARLIPTI